MGNFQLSGRAVRVSGIAVAVLLVLLMLLMLWCALAALLGLRHVAAVRAHAATLQQQLTAGDHEGSAASVRSLAEASAGAQRWLGGAPWTAMGWLPVVGDTLDATTTTADALGTVVGQLAPPTVALLEAPDSNVAAVSSAMAQQSGALAEAARAAVAAAPRLAAIDTSALIGPVAGPVAEIQTRYPDLVDGVTGLAAASVLLPGLLGSDGPTEWLMVASQPAEARGSGTGFFGAFGVMQADAGQLRLAASLPNDVLFGAPVSLAGQPPEFEQLWGESAAYVRSHNLTRHFPFAAELLTESVARAGVDPAFIVAVDPRTVAALLKITGPVSAAGVTIDDTTAEAYLTNGIYLQFPDPEIKDEVALQLMTAVLSALMGQDASLIELAPAMAQAVQEGRFVAWASDPLRQQVLQLSPMAGALPADPATLTASINNAAGNKLDVYLESAVDVELEGECGGPARGRATITLTSSGVPEGLPPYVADSVRAPAPYGSNRSLVHLYGPPGSRLESFTLNGEPALVSAGTELGRPVWGALVDLLPDQQVALEVRFAGDLPAEPFRFEPQPMVRDTAVAVSDRRHC